MTLNILNASKHVQRNTCKEMEHAHESLLLISWFGGRGPSGDMPRVLLPKRGHPV